MLRGGGVWGGGGGRSGIESKRKCATLNVVSPAAL